VHTVVLLSSFGFGLQVIHQTLAILSVSSGYPNTEKWVEKNEAQPSFLTDFEVFGNLMKHSFQVCDTASQTINNS